VFDGEAKTFSRHLIRHNCLCFVDKAERRFVCEQGNEPKLVKYFD